MTKAVTPTAPKLTISKGRANAAMLALVSANKAQADIFKKATNKSGIAILNLNRPQAIKLATALMIGTRKAKFPSGQQRGSVKKVVGALIEAHGLTRDELGVKPKVEVIEPTPELKVTKADAEGGKPGATTRLN